MDPTTLRVEEILGDAFVDAYGLADRYDEEPPDRDPEINDERSDSE